MNDYIRDDRNRIAQAGHDLKSYCNSNRSGSKKKYSNPTSGTYFPINQQKSLVPSSSITSIVDKRHSRNVSKSQLQTTSILDMPATQHESQLTYFTQLADPQMSRMSSKSVWPHLDTLSKFKMA